MRQCQDLPGVLEILDFQSCPAARSTRFDWFVSELAVPMDVKLSTGSFDDVLAAVTEIADSRSNARAPLLPSGHQTWESLLD